MNLICKYIWKYSHKEYITCKIILFYLISMKLVKEITNNCWKRHLFWNFFYLDDFAELDSKMILHWYHSSSKISSVRILSFKDELCYIDELNII